MAHDLQADTWPWVLVPSSMADDSSTSRCILLKDIVGEQGGRSTWLGFVHSPPSTVNIQRGELLVVSSSSPEDKSLQDHQQQSKLSCKLCRDSNISIECNLEEVACLDLAEFELLEAVESPEARYEEFCMDRKLRWATMLMLGSTVHVRLTDEAGTLVQYAEGTVKYMGKVGKRPGQMFGIEITEQRFRGLGSSNGRYNDTRYFPCDNKCGEFVALDGLSRMKVEHKRKFRSLHLGQRSDFLASTTVGVPSGERVIVYNRKNVPIHGMVRWRGRHGTLGDIVGIETDIVVSRRDFSDAIPGLADQFSIEPNHGRITLPSSLTLREMPPRDLEHSQSQAQNQFERSDTPKEAQSIGIGAAKHPHEDVHEKKRTRSTGSGSDRPLVHKHKLLDTVQSHDTLVVLNQELERSVRSQEEQIRQQQEQIQRLHSQLTKMAASGDEKEQKLILVEYQLVEQRAETDRLNQTLSQIQEENSELRRRVAEKDESLGQLQQQNTQLEDQLTQKDGEVTQLQQCNERLEAEKRALEVEKQALEAEKQTLEVEKQALEVEKRTLEVEKRVLEDQYAAALAPKKSLVVPDKMHFWEVSHKEVEVSSTILGTGAWGWVSEGMFHGKLVAVKRLHKQLVSQFTVEHICREISIMAQLRHPNLVLFIAAVMDSEGGPLIITEILNMSLRQAANQKLLRESFVKLSIFQDVAAALNYLHQHQEPIIHRDVSSSNVLLEPLPQNLWRAKLSDFGSANLARYSATPGEGATVYAAPEAAKGPQTPKMDVFSFGILMCEIVTGEFPGSTDLLQSVKQTWTSIHKLIAQCVEHDVQYRPTMNQVLQSLNSC